MAEGAGGGRIVNSNLTKKLNLYLKLINRTPEL